ncbi:hypothetical protein NITUZ_30368 [Candidatus Nitrosotenuis uzonensis]|uniref:Uncharacterized protein n=1 Tax=Candidatus Nitrosotenuis uzonensis TaxID=1407055 RepID=V6ASK0_9ARCH|nr:hypothetical protein NITUZ_30368 [Candidatus Nitrosotenuis uzonensis]
MCSHKQHPDKIAEMQTAYMRGHAGITGRHVHICRLQKLLERLYISKTACCHGC